MPVETGQYSGASGGFVDPMSEAEPRYKVASNAPFVYLAHPIRWDVYTTKNGERILPFLAQFRLQPGIAGVRQIEGQQAGDAGAALANQAAKGWIQIPAKMDGLIAFGEPVPSYVRRVMTTANDRRGVPLYSYCSAWELPYRVGSEVYYKNDPDGYYDFLELVAQQILPKIDPNVITQLSARIREHLYALKAASAKTGMGSLDLETLDKKTEAFSSKQKQAAMADKQEGKK